MKKAVRILLVGEPGVGKTSLVLSLVSEEFPERVPPRSEEITIPADVTPEQVPTNIVDYSEREQSEQELLEELHRADVICIIYSVDDPHTLKQVTHRWLPYVRQILGDDHRRPVILVGNKTDATDANTLDTAVQAMNEFIEVETCVECSARSMKNISEMFYYAQKAVLHPTAPLYDADKKELQPNCKAAMERIFAICDTDNDGILSDEELNNFQKKCFNAPLAAQSLQDVKGIVRKYCSNGVANDGLTLDGFLTLHLLFIQRGRHETTWTVLRKFGYDDSLHLSKEYLYPQLHVEQGSTTELTHLGYQFLQTLFEKYDKDRDGCLSPTELKDLFSTCPFLPWGDDVLNTVQTSKQNWITNAGYLAQWTLTTYLDKERALEYLAYLGYLYEHDTQRTGICVTRNKTIDRTRRQTNRNVFLCHVIGPKGVGKTHFLQGLLGRNMASLREQSSAPSSAYAISQVKVFAAEKYLLMREIDAEITELLSPGDLDCDVACLVYDASNPESFKFCATTYAKHFAESEIPLLIVACKSEKAHVVQKYDVAPEEFCKANGLAPPQFYSAVDPTPSQLYTTLATMAVHPCADPGAIVYTLMADNWRAWLRRQLYRQALHVAEDETTRWIKIAAVISIAIGIALGLYKYGRNKINNS